MRKFKESKSVYMLFFGLLLAGSAIAQDTEPISDEDLGKYVSAMYKVDQMKAEGKAQYLGMIKGEELMQGGKRFNAIKKAKGDEAKLAEIEATEAELAAYDTLLKGNEKIAAAIKAKFTTIIKEDIGAGIYNKIKKQLRTDEALKAKYDELYATLKNQEDEVAETEEK